VAVEFAKHLLYPYDRVSVITFDRLAHNATEAVDPSNKGWQDNITQVKDTINALKVYQPEECNNPQPEVGNCLDYYDLDGDGSPDQLAIDCMYPKYHAGDLTSCTSSNIGGGLRLANYQFSRKERLEALWIVILLAGGPANAIDPDPENGYPYGYCSPHFWNSPPCRDDLADVRHDSTHIDYDGDDYARDIADQLVGDSGQGAIIYSIGLGEKVRNDPRHRSVNFDPDIAEKLLIYIATEAGTPDPGDLLLRRRYIRADRCFQKNC